MKLLVRFLVKLRVRHLLLEKFIRCIIIVLVLLFSESANAQTVVGMGTERPNPNAVLELVSENHDQGLLVPRLSESEATLLSEKLTSSDNGLIIFLSDQGKFFYWWNDNWRSLEPNASPANPETGLSTLPQGHLWVGGSDSNPITLDASSEAQILVGDGSTVASVTITGDLQLQPDGTLTLKNTVVTTNTLADAAVTNSKLAPDAVSKDKIHPDVAGSGLSQSGDGSLQVANTGPGELLIGQGDSAMAQSISGDLNLSANGTTRIAGLQGRPLSDTAPDPNQILAWNGSAWVPNDVSLLSFGGFGKKWYSGTSTPTSNIPAESVDGDFYYDMDDNLAYLKESGNWTALSGFSQPPASINTGGIADSYRAPVLYIGDTNPVDGDVIGEVGDFYYSRTEEKLYYRYLDVSKGLIKWKAF